MDIHEWMQSKISKILPLNEYPVGEFLPFKSKNGYYMWLHRITMEGVHIYYYTDLSSDEYINAYYVQNDNTIHPPHLEPFTVDWNNRYE